MPKRTKPLLLPKPYDLRERAFLFAAQLLDVCSKLPLTPEAGVVRQQLARAGTSVGANVKEADGAMSKADRRRSLVIARKEALETRYWLRLVQARWPKDIDIHADLQEVSEIIRILSKLIQLLS